MPQIGQIIRQHRHDRGWTLQRLADAAGCSKAYLSGVENARVANPPRPGILRRIERAFDLPPGTLLRLREWDTTPESVRRDYRWLVRQLQQISAPVIDTPHRSPRDQHAERDDRAARPGVDLDTLFRSGALQRCVDDTAGNVAPIDTRSPDSPRVPLINSVAAGYPSHFTDLDYPARIADEYLAVPGVSDPDIFAARVVGDSMLPDYRAGDIIVFSPARDAADGDDCFVRLEPDHDTTFKRVFFEDSGERVRLQPLNDRFPPRTVDREHVAGLYPAVYRVSPIGGV